jgi:hypothetical protein
MNIRVPGDRPDIDLDIGRDELKALVKASIKEWMTEQFACVAWFSTKALFSSALAMLFGAVVFAWAHYGFGLDKK